MPSNGVTGVVRAPLQPGSAERFRTDPLHILRVGAVVLTPATAVGCYTVLLACVCGLTFLACACAFVGFLL